jgi:hypothetical protein
MSKSIFVTEERHLVATENLAMVAGGLNLFNCPTGKRGKREKLFFTAGVPGQMVAFVYDSTVSTVPQTVGVADIPTISGDLYIGILVDQDNDGVADDVRLIAGEHLTKCDVDKISIGRPSCGQPAVVAASIDCVSPNETYTAKVTLDDNRTRSFGPWNKTAAEFIGTYVTSSEACDSCPVEQNCREITCGIVDSLNNELDPMINDRIYPDWKGKGLPRPYRAVVGHKHWYTYCFTPDPEACDCEDCSKIDAIASAEVGGVTLTLAGNFDPNNLSGSATPKTLLPQLNNIAAQIENSFDDNIGDNSGFVVVLENTGKCKCGTTMFVVTCDPGFQLTDDAGTAVPPCAVAPIIDMSFLPSTGCTQVDPTTGNCVTAAGVAYEPECWIAVIASPEVPNCDMCYLERPWTWHGINLTLDFLKEPHETSPVIKNKTIVESVAPRNFGSQIQFLEYANGFPSGRGRKYSTGNYRRGWVGDYEKGAKIRNAVTADCKQFYCSYFFEYARTQTDQLSNSLRQFPFISAIHIPETYTNAKASWELFFTALVEANNGSCRVINGETC